MNGGESKTAGAAAEAAGAIGRRLRGKPALALGALAAGGAGAAGYVAGQDEGRSDLLKEQEEAALNHRREQLRQRIMMMLQQGSGGYGG